MSQPQKTRALSVLGPPGSDLSGDPRYHSFFSLFNQELFFEAHEVLEELWLSERSRPNAAFYKGLIQLAGAFVHLQKDRLRPAAALLKRATYHLNPYSPRHEQLDVAATLHCANQWLDQIESTLFEVNPLAAKLAPKITLIV
jgi:predicted metal-dependent hydrolase